MLTTLPNALTYTLALLAGIPTDTPAPPLHPVTVQTVDLGRLSWHQARALSGQRVRVVFTVDSLPDDTGDEVLVDARNPDWASRAVRFGPRMAPPSVRVGQVLTARGVLTTRYIPARTTGGESFPEVWVIEVQDARLVEG
jgi:hypothetical protein